MIWIFWGSQSIVGVEVKEKLKRSWFIIRGILETENLKE